MKKFQQFNTYLLERFPTIWNTKLVWMLGIAAIIHTIFFFYGFVRYMDPVTLHKGWILQDYFKGGLFFIHCIISILLVVGWLIAMFKNNSFKSFYPNSRTKLFLQFFYYIIILLACTSFYFSYLMGVKTNVNIKYNDKEFAQDIEKINKAYPFLSINPELYTLDKRVYPQRIKDLYLETDQDQIDRSKSFYKLYNRYYQYYSLYAKKSFTKNQYGEYVAPKEEASANIDHVSKVTFNDHAVFYYKKQVEDVTKMVPHAELSYYNFSDFFFEPNNNLFSKNNRYDGSYMGEEYKRSMYFNKQIQEILNRNDRKEIQSILRDFLAVAKKYDITTNLTAEEWIDLVHHPNDYKVLNFIKKYNNKPNEKYDVNNTSYLNSDEYTTPIVSEVQSQDEFNTMFENRLTAYYFYSEQLSNVLDNIQDIKSESYFRHYIHINLWIVYALAIFIFCFRMFGIKSLIFSGITAGLLVLFISLTMILSFQLIQMVNEELYGMCFVFIIGCVILLVPLFFRSYLNKMISSILMIITIIGFIPWTWLGLHIIDNIQTLDCRYSNQSEVCLSILDFHELSISGGLFMIALGFLFFYSKVILNWKAMPQ